MRCDARVLVTRREGSAEVFEYTEKLEVFIHRAGEVFIHFSGAGEAGEVFIYRPTLMQYLSGAEEGHSSI